MVNNYMGRKQESCGQACRFWLEQCDGVVVHLLMLNDTAHCNGNYWKSPLEMC
jgi:hypothetical protein